jgi:excisionase family DNA binding protein
MQLGSEAPLPGESTLLSTIATSSAVGRILGVDELAAFFGCSREKIKRRARSGELPAFKFGKTWYMREQDLRSFIDRSVDSVLEPGLRRR